MQRFLSEHIVNSVVVVGDLVGYGASPGPVIDFVQQEHWKVGLGSSDLRVAMEFGEREDRRGVADQVLPGPAPCSRRSSSNTCAACRRAGGS